VFSFFVDQGRLAQPETAAPVPGAAFVGETELHHAKWSGACGTRTPEELFQAIKDFFTANPTWE
jgi:hypothetical protein